MLAIMKYRLTRVGNIPGINKFKDVLFRLVGSQQFQLMKGGTESYNRMSLFFLLESYSKNMIKRIATTHYPLTEI